MVFYLYNEAAENDYEAAYHNLGKYYQYGICIEAFKNHLKEVMEIHNSNLAIESIYYFLYIYIKLLFCDKMFQKTFYSIRLYCEMIYPELIGLT